MFVGSLGLGFPAHRPLSPCSSTLKPLCSTRVFSSRCKCLRTAAFWSCSRAAPAKLPIWHPSPKGCPMGTVVQWSFTFGTIKAPPTYLHHSCSHRSATLESSSTGTSFPAFFTRPVPLVRGFASLQIGTVGISSFHSCASTLNRRGVWLP